MIIKDCIILSVKKIVHYPLIECSDVRFNSDLNALVNENTGQQIRMFMTDEELEWKMKNAINIAREVN